MTFLDFILFLFVAFMGGLGLMIAVARLAKDGIPWKILTAGHKKPLVLTESRDGENIWIEKVDDPSTGLYSTDEVDYMITEDAVVNMAGVPVMRTTEDAGVGIPLRMAAYTQWLKERHDIHDDEELELSIMHEALKQNAFKKDILAEARQKGAYTLPDNPDREVSTGDIGLEHVDLNELGVGIQDVNFEELRGFDMGAPLIGGPQPAVKFKDFRRFMKQNINPALIKAKIAKREAQLREELQGFKLDAETGMSILFMLVGIGIVAYVVMGGGFI